jgi:DNA-binding GntR family transcriptional regulator
VITMSTAGPHSSMRERIADTLRNAILNGELRPGQRITESEVAAQLGTSRAPVREAIRELVNEGFLESHAYRETRVSSVTLEELRDVLVPIRIVTETFALRRLMAAPDDDALVELDAVVRAMQGALADHDRGRVIDEDLAFHRVLVNAAPYSHPARIWASITPVIYRAFVVGTTDTTMEETVEGHVHLMRAIRSGDVEAAVAYLTEHIREMELRFTADAAPETPAPARRGTEAGKHG